MTSTGSGGGERGPGLCFKSRVSSLLVEEPPMRGAGRLAAASGAMEGNTHLLQVIREMRSQIDELERENRALRGELRACGPGTTAARAGSLAGPTARPDPASGPTAAASEQAGTVTPLCAARAGPLLWSLLICRRGGRASCCMAAFTSCSGLPRCPRPQPLSLFSHSVISQGAHTGLSAALGSSSSEAFTSGSSACLC